MEICADADRRLEWAKRLAQKLSMGEICIKTVIFSDEKRFLIDGPDMHRKEKSVRELFYKRLFSPSFIVWAGIGFNGTTSLHITESSIDAQRYVNILQEDYLPFHRNRYILMHDNAPPHCAHLTKSYLETKKIVSLE